MIELLQLQHLFCPATGGEGGEVLLDVGLTLVQVVPLDPAVLEAAGAVLTQLAVLLLKSESLEVHVRKGFGPRHTSDIRQSGKSDIGL